eukprot:1158388-Pelagomonas_calceolata.AAC.2
MPVVVGLRQSCTSTRAVQRQSRVCGKQKSLGHRQGRARELSRAVPLHLLNIQRKRKSYTCGKHPKR